MSEADRGSPKGVTRRRFLITGGVAAALLHSKGALARGAAGGVPAATVTRNSVGLIGPGIRHGSALVTELSAGVSNSLHPLHSASRDTAQFVRMFPDLPAHNPTDEALTSLAGRIPVGAARNPDNTGIPAGFTFLGQFIDHDVTFDEVSNLLGTNDPSNVTSSASTKFDLDSLYGGGPSVRPELYDPGDPNKLLIVSPKGVADVPRQSGGEAIIADPRNDQHKIIVHIHLAFMNFHNKVVDHLRGLGTPEDSVFNTAQQLVRWHYQWIIIKDYLPRIVGQTVVGQILVTGADGLPRVVTQFYQPPFGNATMPVEFSVAAFRFGHSQIRDVYRIGTSSAVSSIFPRLNGGSAITSQTVVHLGNFFPIPGLGRQAQPSKRIDGAISRPLEELPTNVTGDGLMPNLAERNLRRGKSFGLPSGQQVAAALGDPVISNEELGLTDPGLQGEAPLWFYILEEASLRQSGARLGQVGARIVAEVLLGMLGADPNSFINVNPGFQPVPPIAPTAGVFTMSDLVRFSGVPL